ncbi:MAG: hypothetical protein GX539_07090 [Candidatus Cloacimonetes bacterium]|nr:hypothetical protein [Candidatus Cloacimonadota bacterium]
MNPTAGLTVARSLLRRGGPASLGLAAVFSLVAFAQDSAGLRRLGLGLAWDGHAAFQLLLACAWPLLWILSRGPGAASWERRAAGRRPVTSLWSGITGSGITVLAVHSALALLLDLALTGAFSPARALAAFAAAALGLPPLAALAVAVDAQVRSPVWAIGIWLLVLAASLGLFGLGLPLPLDRLAALGEGGAAPGAAVLAAVTTATAAGWALARLDSRRQPESRPSCASASSATSTATSKR